MFRGWPIPTAALGKAFFLFLCFFIGFQNFVDTFTFKDIKAECGKVNIVPEIIDQAPKQDIELHINNVTVDFGERFSLDPLVNPPQEISWKTQRHGIYTLVLSGPDVPSWEDPFEREYQHWIVVNIPGCNVSQGETITDYVGAQYAYKPGVHRLIYMVFKQPESKPMKFADRRETNETSYLLRAFFNTRKFMKNHTLTLWAINYLIVECCIF